MITLRPVAALATLHAFSTPSAPLLNSATFRARRSAIDSATTHLTCSILSSLTSLDRDSRTEPPIPAIGEADGVRPLPARRGDDRDLRWTGDDGAHGHALRARTPSPVAP